MEETWQYIIEVFNKVKGSGMIFALLFCALLFILINNKKNLIWSLSIYSIVVLGVFFFPPAAQFLSQNVFGKDVYWRFLWLIPINIIIAFAAVKIIENQQILLRKIIIGIACTAIIIMCGTYIFTDVNYTERANLFKVPSESTAIADVIASNIENPKAAVSPELAPYIRQYNPEINLTYGRAGKKMSNEGAYHESKYVYSVMTGEIPITDLSVVERISDSLLTSGTNTLVVTPDSPIYPYLGELGAVYVDEVYGYQIYML